MAEKDVLRVPVLYLLTALGAGMGFYMTYIHGPLKDEVTALQERVNVMTTEMAELKSDVRHLEERK